MMIAIFEYMDRIVDMVRPRKLLYMAIGKYTSKVNIVAVLFLTVACI
jgi:5'-3' exonuclease